MTAVWGIVAAGAATFSEGPGRRLSDGVPWIPRRIFCIGVVGRNAGGTLFLVFCGPLVEEVWEACVGTILRLPDVPMAHFDRNVLITNNFGIWLHMARLLSAPGKCSVLRLSFKPC